MLKTISKYVMLFGIGGLTYYIIEIMARGFSHWTMLLTGGLCFVLIGLINEVTPKMPLIRQMLLSMTIVTGIEFFVGCIVNLWLNWDIWDYSGRVLNVLGQICLQNTLYWFTLSPAAIILDDYMRYWVYGEDKPHYKIF